MVFPYLVDGERRFVQAVLTARVTGRDIVETIEAIYGDPAWRPEFDIVWNCSGVADLDIQPHDVEAVAALRQTLAEGDSPGADVIVVKKILDDGMARLYAAMRRNDRRQTQLCASEKSALELLARRRGPEPA